jgi:hypothetical protein
MPESKGGVTNTAGKWSNMRILLRRAQNNNGTRLPLFHKGFGLKYNNLNPNELKVINRWIHH